MGQPPVVDPGVLTVAGNWIITHVSRETSPGHASHPGRRQAHLVCGCGQSVWCLAPDLDRPGYSVTWAEVLVGIVAHIRQCHEDALDLP